jgi:predicted transcriptional regulator
MSKRQAAEENAAYNEKPDRDYFTMIPNMIFYIGLTPYDVRLYCELKRIAGDYGKCWMKTKNLAKICNMSMGTVSNSKQHLKEFGLIEIEEFSAEIGVYHEIKIIDIWESNTQFCKNRAASDSRSPHEWENSISRSPDEQPRSPHELINIPINKNPYMPQKKLQEKPVPPAKKGNGMNKEEYQESLAKSLAIGLTRGAYAHYPERIRPVVEKMELWHFKPPARKGKDIASWIMSCEDILEACAEFGVNMLDELHNDWDLYLDANGGSPPYSVGHPRSLLSAVRGKAALKRGGSNAPYWKTGQPQKRPRLDV